MSVTSGFPVIRPEPTKIVLNSVTEERSIYE